MCTTTVIKTRDNEIIVGRTQEYSALFLSEIVFIPRNTKLPSTFLLKTDYYFINKYSFIYQNGPGVIDDKYLVIEGMNEHGLSVSMLDFPFAKFPQIDQEEINFEKINIMYLSSYLLSNFKSVDEIKIQFDEIISKFY